METYLHIGGGVAAGFDPSGSFLLVVTHSGRGVFLTRTWERVARDFAMAYPVNGEAVGIGPIAGQRIAVTGMDFDRGMFELVSPDGKVELTCESSGIEVKVADG